MIIIIIIESYFVEYNMAFQRHLRRLDLGNPGQKKQKKPIKRISTLLLTLKIVQAQNYPSMQTLSLGNSIMSCFFRFHIVVYHNLSCDLVYTVLCWKRATVHFQLAVSSNFKPTPLVNGANVH